MKKNKPDDAMLAAMTSQFENLCMDVINEKGWRPFSDIKVNVSEFPFVLGALIELKNRNIVLNVNPNIHDYVGKVNRILNKKGKSMSIEDLMYFAVNHEHGHHEFCPANHEGLQKILEGSFEAIEGREYRKNRIKQLCLELHNMISDTVLNTIIANKDREKEKFRSGLEGFYLMNGEFLRSAKQKYDKAMTLHIDINNYLCNGSADSMDFMNKYNPLVFLGRERYQRKLIDVFTGNEGMTREIMARGMTSEISQYLVQRLEDSSLWKQMSYDYATIMYPFLNKQHEMLQNSFTSGGSSQKNKSGGQGKQEQQDSNDNQDKQQKKENGKEGDKSGKGDSKEGGNEGNEKKDKNEGAGKDEKKENKSKENDKSDKNKGNGKDNSDSKNNQKPDNKYERGVGSGKSGKNFDDMFDDVLNRKYESVPFTIVESFNELDELYRRRAENVALIFSEDDGLQKQHEQYMSRERIPLDEFASSKTDWSSTRVFKNKGKTKDVELYRKSNPLIMPIDSDKNHGGLVDLSFILDSSASMGFDPYNGFGEYHLAVLTFYSILKDLEDKGLAPLINYHMINFSGGDPFKAIKESTHSSGWHSYHDLPEIKKVLFSYQGNGTVLDPDALSEMSRERKDNFISFMLTDGEFNEAKNEENVIDEITKLHASGGAGVYLFKMGYENNFSNSLRSAGIPVQRVESAEDFMKKAIKFTKDMYGEVARK